MAQYYFNVYFFPKEENNLFCWARTGRPFVGLLGNLEQNCKL